MRVIKSRRMRWAGQVARTGEGRWSYSVLGGNWRETLSLTLREERKVRVFDNMVLRRIFRPRSDELTGNGGDCITRS